MLSCREELASFLILKRYSTCVSGNLSEKISQRFSELLTPGPKEWKGPGIRKRSVAPWLTPYCQATIPIVWLFALPSQHLRVEFPALCTPSPPRHLLSCLAFIQISKWAFGLLRSYWSRPELASKGGEVLESDSAGLPQNFASACECDLINSCWHNCTVMPANVFNRQLTSTTWMWGEVTIGIRQNIMENWHHQGNAASDSTVHVCIGI